MLIYDNLPPATLRLRPWYADRNLKRLATTRDERRLRRPDEPGGLWDPDATPARNSRAPRAARPATPDVDEPHASAVASTHPPTRLSSAWNSSDPRPRATGLP